MTYFQSVGKNLLVVPEAEARLPCQISVMVELPGLAVLACCTSSLTTVKTNVHVSLIIICLIYYSVSYSQDIGVGS